MLRFFEDFPVGWSETFGPISATKDEIVAFAREYDAQPFHTDEAAAKNTFVGTHRLRLAHLCPQHAACRREPSARRNLHGRSRRR